jgi:hypothetical protein
MTAMPETIDDWLEAVPDDEYRLAGATLDAVRDTLEGAEETVKWKQP